MGFYLWILKKQIMVMDFGGELQIIQVGLDNLYNGGFNVSFFVFVLMFYKSINLIKIDVELVVEKVCLLKLDLVNQVIKVYYQLLLVQDSYKVFLQSYVQVEVNYEVVKVKYEQGMVSEYDKICVDVQVCSLKFLVVFVGNGVNFVCLQLQVLMGMDMEVEIVVDGNLKDYEMVMFCCQMESNQLNLNNNSDLKQLDLNVDLLKKILVVQ